MRIVSEMTFEVNDYLKNLAEGLTFLKNDI